MPDTYFTTGPKGFLYIQDVDVELTYKSYRDEYDARLTVAGTGDLHNDSPYPSSAGRYTFKFSWYLLDSSGEQVSFTRQENFSSIQVDPDTGAFSKELGRITLKPGETYQLVFEVE